MKLLIINTVPMEKNGITNVILNLFSAWDKSDMIVDLLTINQPDTCIIEEIERYGGRVYVVERNIKYPFRYAYKVKKIVEEGNYDIVHAHGNSRTLVLEMMAAKMAKCKVRIAHAHNTICKYKVLHYILTPLFFKSYTHGVACSVDAGKWLFANKEFMVLNNGIDTERFRFNIDARKQIREQYAIEEDAVVIGNVGHFKTAVKNQTFLLEIFNHIRETDKAFYLMFIGDGNLRSQIEKKTKEEQLEDKVFFIGNVDEVEKYLAGCDIIVMPSLYEGLPLSLLEEQANGLMCVVSDRVTTEANKTGNLIFLPLEAGVEVWAEKIKKVALPKERNVASEDAIQKIVENGYCLFSEAKRIKKYYVDCLE